MMNYLEMLDSIKWGIFTGEMGGLYMLARGIACICACVSLIWWYNKYMNDPFAQLEEEEEFITKTEYEARIKALAEEIAALEARLALMNTPGTGEDLPVGGQPTDTSQETTPDTAPPTDTPATIAFHYEIREGEAVILSYLGKESRVTVPAAIGNYPVTSIEEAAFRATPVSSVVIPDSVTKIGWFAFADCPSLTSITLPASVSNIGYGAFDGCRNVTLYCPSGSYAAKYAISFGLRYEYHS